MKCYGELLSMWVFFKSPYSISNVVMQWCRCFNFKIYMMFLSMRLFVCPVSSLNRNVLLCVWRYLMWNCGTFYPYPRRNNITRSWALGLSPTSLLLTAKKKATRRSNQFSRFMWIMILTYDLGDLEEGIVSSLERWTRSALDNYW